MSRSAETTTVPDGAIYPDYRVAFRLVISRSNGLSLRLYGHCWQMAWFLELIVRLALHIPKEEHEVVVIEF